MNTLQDAISRAITPSTQPSSDPAQSSLVMAGVRWLGNTLPEAEIAVKVSRDDDEDEVIEDHPLVTLLDEPNPFHTSTDLDTAFAWNWIISGNVYWLKFRNAVGQVIQLWNEPYWSIKPRWVGDKQGYYIPGGESQSVAAVPRNDQPNQFINYYEVDRDGAKFRIEVADVVHFRDGEDPYNRRLGLSAIMTILREIFADSAVATHAGQLLSSSGIPPYVLSVNTSLQALTQEDVDRTKANLLRQASTGEPMVVTNATVEKLGLSPQELDQRVSRYISEERFSAVTGIPAIVLNFGSGMERSIYNNMSEADRRATESYLIPLWWRRDKTLTKQLLRDFDQDLNHFVESDTSEVAALQENQDALWKRNTEALKAGGITRKQFLINLNLPFEDERDDVYVGPNPIQSVAQAEEPEPVPQIPASPSPRLLPQRVA
jgi:phage portal protein BeeE